MSPHTLAVTAALRKADEESIRQSPLKQYVLLSDRLLRHAQGLPPKTLEHEEVVGRAIAAEAALALMVPRPERLGDFIVRYLGTFLVHAAQVYEIPVTGLAYAHVVHIVHTYHRDLWNRMAAELNLQP